MKDENTLRAIGVDEDDDPEDMMTMTDAMEWVAVCILIVRKVVALPTEQQRDGRSLAEWLREDTLVTEEEFQAAVHEAETMEPEKRGLILMQAQPDNYDA